MKAYILKRLLSMIPVLLIVAIFVFFLIHMIPGDPAAVMLGPEATPEEVESLKEELGLNLPIYQQFFEWSLHALQGDLGNSLYMNQPVLDAFIGHLGPTLSLALLAQGVSIFLAIPIGVLAARKRGTGVDRTFMIIAMLGMSIPSFLLALLLMLVFGVQLNWLPVAGYSSLGEGLWEHLKYLILPAISLGTIQAAVIARMTRSSMIDILSMNFIKTAKAKGLKQKVVIYKHAFRNALIPILTILGETFGALITGAVVTETVFNLPGIGQLVINAITRRDYAVIQGTILLIAVTYLFLNLIIDLLYGLVDPRVRLNRK
ncbi:ABC transporter permease [Bhargavaea beijingensis]|uniref:ABC transporter permease n=1 Tax=Bhargavaea beijingensis TaxID=426756 RepID=A0A1G6Z445_9BACL|nr:ABC transporter permease [Bhargavaea beijingensis]MCW1929275.1 ABC transporter permease [Bhargavaea beijingensis]RSK36511.1 ABC transporter permease [Bhargavaea beijingensis]SDD97388.1 peptide/nickel transport system permease protein [Bhargavaea beijingensis]